LTCGLLRAKNDYVFAQNDYREKKNLYLCRQDYNHPSFNVYVETVNQVFNKYFD